MISAGQMHRLTREHALFVTCACLAILLLGFPLSIGNWKSLNFSIGDSRADESQVDSALQQSAAATLGEREGAIIVIDPQTGRIRALVNSQMAFGQPLMPGSTMKPFTALAALRAGLINKDSRTVCPGRFNGRSFSLACVHEDHLPPFTPSQAIAYSCNYYFATLGQKLGRDALIETARQFGFGEATGISGGANGTLRPCETGNDARIRETDHASMQSDCDAREAIGESDHIQITPIQLLAAYAALVNGGHLFQPLNNQSPVVQRSQIDISSLQRNIIIEGLRGAVRYGTAKSAHLDSLPLYIIGKTGTSQPAKGFRPNGWFVGFAAHAPANASSEPGADEIGLGVLVLVAHAHGSEAAALAKPIFETFAEKVENSQPTAPAKPSGNGGTNPPDFAIRDPKSAFVKVHLVTENVTREMSLEDYVLGVMQAEGTMETEPEALKALAVAVRTYALKNRGRHARDGYDFCSTTHCQRFFGRDPTVSEGASLIGGTSAASTQSTLPDGRISAAVRSTEGQVLVDDREQLVDSYFGASCGGETANLGTLWGKPPPPYLRGVRDEYCLSGPHATWTDNISRADLLRALQSDARTNVGTRLDQIVVSKRDDTGRAEFIAIEGENRKTVRGWDFKIIVGRVLGWNLLKSSRFEVARQGSNFIFRGSGFGHGLGLCQEGAHVMAARGIGYQRILEKYFPGTLLKKNSDSAGLADVAKTNSGNGWKADVLSDASEGNSISLPLSAKVFIGSNSEMPAQVRTSAMSFTPPFDGRSQFALIHPSNPLGYRYPAAARLSTGPRFLTISSDHFHVTYPADEDRRAANQALNTLESAREDYLRRASYVSLTVNIPTLDIRFNESTGDFTARTHQPWWAAAATKGNHIELQPVTLLQRRGALITTLRHELAHVVIDAVSNNRAPRWLAEGFAIYLAGEGQAISRFKMRGTISTDDLERQLERPGSQQDMRALYAAAYLKVNQLIFKESEAGLWRRLAMTKTSNAQHLGMSLFETAQATHERIIANPKSPRLVHPLFRVINTDARAARNLTPRNRNPFFNPNALAKQICFIQFTIDSQRQT